MFTNPSLNGGTIRIGQKSVFDFYYTSEVDHITNIHGCGCTSIENLPNNNLIRLVYVPSRIPKHYEPQGHWTTTKPFIITIQLKDGTETTETISFTVTVTK